MHILFFIITFAHNQLKTKIMQAEEKDYFKLLVYNLFLYASDSDFKDSYKKKYGLTDEQYSNQCHMFLSKISQSYPFNKDENNKKQGDMNDNSDIFKDVLHSCIVGFLSKIDISNDYAMNYEMHKYAKHIINTAKTITKELQERQND